MQFLRYLILIIFVLFTNNVKAETKIAFIDIDYLMKNSNIGKISLKKLDNLNNKNINVLKENEKKLKQEENLLLQKQDIISQEEFEKELKILRNKIKEFNINKEKMVKDYNKFKSQELNITLQKFNKKIQEFMSQNSIEILLDKNNIYIGTVSSDITKEVLIAINNEFKE
ncbi:OmpH family outer membrane protein [Candidatus Pelagibacter sp.]|jgi:outer membrane protein|nr:OmpH family outer membrane protein [Candidatus Pelagibacter sp.]